MAKNPSLENETKMLMASRLKLARGKGRGLIYKKPGGNAAMNIVEQKKIKK